MKKLSLCEWNFPREREIQWLWHTNKLKETEDERSHKIGKEEE